MIPTVEQHIKVQSLLKFTLIKKNAYVMNIVGLGVMIVDSADEVPVEDGEVVVGGVVEVD